MTKSKNFPLELKISPVGTKGKWRLNEEFLYLPSVKYKSVKVPKNFVTNFATVPQVFRSVMSPWGRHGKAAVIHDYLYSLKEVDRKYADKVFLQALKDSGVNFFKRQALYRMVRLFGWYFREV